MIGSADIGRGARGSDRTGGPSTIGATRSHAMASAHTSVSRVANDCPSAALSARGGVLLSSSLTHGACSVASSAAGCATEPPWSRSSSKSTASSANCAAAHALAPFLLSASAAHAMATTRRGAAAASAACVSQRAVIKHAPMSSARRRRWFALCRSTCARARSSRRGHGAREAVKSRRRRAPR